MKLYRISDAPTSHHDQVFRHPPTYLMLLMITFTIVGIALVTMVGGVGYVMAGFIALAILIMRPMLRARRSSSNWIARLTDDGLLLQFRSYLNLHFPEDVETVVRIAYNEIRNARVVQQKWLGSDSEGSTRESRELVELELANGDVALENAIARERNIVAPKEARFYGSSSIRFREYPVRIAENRLYIEWTATPNAQEFVEALAGHGVTTGERVVQDLRKDKEGTAKLIVELAESGKTLRAVRLARDLYGYDLTEARTFIEQLQTSAGKKVK